MVRRTRTSNPWMGSAIATKMMCEIIDSNTEPTARARDPMYTSWSPFAKRGDSAEILNPCPFAVPPARPPDDMKKNQNF